MPTPTPAETAPAATTASEPSFIEAQFPVSKVSKESYKERKANHSQTLTGLGKWWGRKPLVMVRAALIGLLMPASGDPKKDRAIFLKIMTMDEEGMLARKKGNIKYKEAFALLTEEEQERFFDTEAIAGGKMHHHAITEAVHDSKKATKREIQQRAFSRLSYDEKLDQAFRPEEIDGPTAEAWGEINAHLGTDAQSLPELMRALGERRFGHTPRVGDAFCGGGSVPFEAARLGFDAYGADLNPVAVLLTWAALHIVGGGEETAERVREAQRRVYRAVDEQITGWGIEHRTEGPPPGADVEDPDTGEFLGEQIGHWRADAYLYCVEADCPECGATVPLAPSWVIGKRTNTVARLTPDRSAGRVHIEIAQGVSNDEIAEADAAGTVQGGDLVCPACEQATPMRAVRDDRRASGQRNHGLRLWENEDVAPREGDTFGERLYAVRWVQTYEDDDEATRTLRRYRTVTDEDREREAKAQRLLEERFDEWQEQGYLPSRRIEAGYNTDQPIRERGWTHWHHLFNPRQLLVHGLLFREAIHDATAEAQVYAMLCIGRAANWDSRLSMWTSHHTRELNAQVFMNQALNTLYNYGARSLSALGSAWRPEVQGKKVTGDSLSGPQDARAISETCDVWLTDPPYADAVNYHELGEFFLAWSEKPLKRLFPTWYTDSKRALAVKGNEADFKEAMVESYRNLAEHMPEDGMQVVMFTHQDSSVWADLSTILWAAGLRVTAAWTIQTETASALKTGNYVTGTVLLVLRKRTERRSAFGDDIGFEVEDEVVRQIESMRALDTDEREQSFEDTDYQLAAYAAGMRVLTQYSEIDGRDMEAELMRASKNGEPSFAEEVIDKAVEVASNHLIPQGFEEFHWKALSPEERLYLKGLELESHGEMRSGVYEELARGFGAEQYKPLIASSKANATRVKTATEFQSRHLDTGEDAAVDFASSLLRHALFAVRTARKEQDAHAGRAWLRSERRGYWNDRERLIEILRYLGRMGNASEEWAEDAEAARLVAGAVENDHA